MEYRSIQCDKGGVEIAAAIASANGFPVYVQEVALIPCSFGLPEHKVSNSESATVADLARLGAAIVAHNAQNGVGTRICD